MTEDTEVPLLIENRGRLRILTLNRPERLNALTPDLHHRLRDAVTAAAGDPGVGALVLTGAARAFCSGGDVKRSADAASAEPETQEQRADALRGHGITARTLHDMPKPTIAVMNGVAAGAGLALALACDLRLLHRDGFVRTAYARIALPGDLGITYTLQRLVGPAKARELLFLDEKIAANDCLALGIVNRLYEEPDEAMELAARLADGPGIAFRHMKANLALAETATLAQAIEREADSSARCVRTHDVREAAAAFKEKRSPRFENR